MKTARVIVTIHGYHIGEIDIAMESMQPGLREVLTGLDAGPPEAQVMVIMPDGAFLQGERAVKLLNAGQAATEPHPLPKITTIH